MAQKVPIAPAEPLLVTGGAGFIGSAFVRMAVAARLPVVNLDLFTYAGTRESIAEVEGSPLHRLVAGDIRDPHLVASVFRRFRPRAVVHFAAETHVDRSIDASAAFVSTNVVGTQVLLDRALEHWQALPTPRRRRFRFVHVSTDEVYGALGPTGRFDESSPYAPSSPYAASKAAADHLVRAWHRTYGLPTIVTNCGNNYGPFQFPEKLIPLTIGRALAGRALPVYGAGANVRDWIHVDDHCAALFLALERGRPGETYCIGAEQERTNLAVVRALCAVLDAEAPRPDGAPHASAIGFVADRPGHDFRYALDPTRTRRELGWPGGRRFEDGLRATVGWYVRNRAWCESILAGVYDGGRLGLSRRAAGG